MSRALLPGEWHPDPEDLPPVGTPVLITVRRTHGQGPRVQEAYRGFPFAGGPWVWYTPSSPAGTGFLILPESVTAWTHKPRPYDDTTK